MVDGEISTDQGLIKRCITQFYRQLYLENEVHRPLLDDIAFSRISEEDASWLDRPLDEDEVFGVVHDFNGDKAPGPDSFTMAFFSILLEHGENRYYECVSCFSCPHCV